MEYTIDTIVGDCTIYEKFEGTPEEIAKLVNLLDVEEIEKFQNQTNNVTVCL